MRQRLVFIIALTLMAKLSYSQIIDRYGINIGTSYSTQIWNYKFIYVDPDHEYKFGLQSFLQVEKDFGDLMSLRAEFGYIQKGFKNNITLTLTDETEAGTHIGNVILHDLALNFGLKVKPLKTDFSPYLLLGLRGDYMIAYKDIEFEDPISGQVNSTYESIIEEFNKFNLGALIGLGISIKDLIYFEVEYNPNFTKNHDERVVDIKDNCWGAKIGLNINKLIK